MDLVGVLHRRYGFVGADALYGSRHRRPRSGSRRRCVTIAGMARAPSDRRALRAGAARGEARAARAGARGARRASGAARAAASAAIARAIVALPSFAARATVLLTLPFRSEWDTRPLVARRWRAGKTVVVPRVNARGAMLELHAIADLDARRRARAIAAFPSRSRIAAASSSAERSTGCSFPASRSTRRTPAGLRRRLLRSAAAAAPPDAPRIAGAFDVQIVDGVPAAPHDSRVDAIVTESRDRRLARDERS